MPDPKHPQPGDEFAFRWHPSQSQFQVKVRYADDEMVAFLDLDDEPEDGGRPRACSRAEFERFTSEIPLPPQPIYMYAWVARQGDLDWQFQPIPSSANVRSGSFRQVAPGHVGWLLTLRVESAEWLEHKPQILNDDAAPAAG